MLRLMVVSHVPSDRYKRGKQIVSLQAFVAQGFSEVKVAISL